MALSTKAKPNQTLIYIHILYFIDSYLPLLTNFNVKKYLHVDQSVLSYGC
jgi:hypothetical protein